VASNDQSEWACIQLLISSGLRHVPCRDRFPSNEASRSPILGASHTTRKGIFFRIHAHMHVDIAIVHTMHKCTPLLGTHMSRLYTSIGTIYMLDSPSYFVEMYFKHDGIIEVILSCVYGITCRELCTCTVSFLSRTWGTALGATPYALRECDTLLLHLHLPTSWHSKHSSKCLLA
jgi:hypothetical protein